MVFSGRFWGRTKPGTPRVSPPLQINANAEYLALLTSEAGLLLMTFGPFEVLTDLAVVYGEAFDSAGWLDLELHDPDADTPQVTTVHRLPFGDPDGDEPAYRTSTTDAASAYFVSATNVYYGSYRRRELRARLTPGDGAEQPTEGWLDVFATYLPLNEWAA